MPPDIAEVMTTFADYEDVSQNAWITYAVIERIASRRADDRYMTGLAKHYAGKLDKLKP